MLQQALFLSKIFSSSNSFLPQVRKRLLFHNVNISIINNNNSNGKLYHSYHTNLITNIKKTNNNKRSTKKSTSSSLSKKQQQVNNNITNKPSSSSSSTSSTVSSSFTNSNVISSHNSPTTTIISQPKQQQQTNNNNNKQKQEEEEEVDAINFIKQPVSSSNENYSLNNLYDQAFKSKPILQTTSLFTNEFARLSRRKLSNNNIQQQQQLKREEELKEKERMREELLKNINESNNKKINDDSSITTTIKKQEINNNAAITKTNKNFGKKVDKKTKMNVVQKQQEKIVGKKDENKKNEKKLQQDGKNNAQILNKYNPLYINFLNHLRTRFKNISQQQQEEEMTPKIYQNKRKLLTINNTNEKLGESEVVEELFKDKVPNKENNILTSTNNQQEVNKKITTTTTDPTIAQKKYSLTEIKKHILKLKELSKTGNLQELETYFKKNIEYPNIFHYNLLLSSFARYLKFDLCENYFKEMEYKSIETNNIMLEVYLKSKQFDKLQKLFKSMKIHDEQSWNILLEMFEKLDNNLQRVKQCFRIIPNPTIENFNMLMEIFLRHRHYQMVEVIFNELMSISNNNLINNNNNSKGGISDNNNIKNNNNKEYNFITNKDNNNELVPNEITYDLILRSYLGLNHFDKLLSTFNQIPEELNSTLHYITLFEMYRRQQQQQQQNNNNNVAEKMEELFLNKIPKHKRKHEQINALIIAFGKSGNLDKAKYYFENVLEEHGFEPNEYDFTAYLDACATVGSKIRTQQFFNSIPNPTGHDYSILMQCYVKAKEFARAEEIFYSFKGVEPEPHMHSLLVAALVGQKKEVRAERHVRELLLLSDNSGNNNNNNNNSKLRKSPQFYSVCMFELAKSTKSIKFIEELYNNCPFKDDILILNNYLFAYAMIGDVKKVEEIFKTIPKPNEKTFEYRERAYSVAKELQKQQNRRQQW